MPTQGMLHVWSPAREAAPGSWAARRAAMACAAAMLDCTTSLPCWAWAAYGLEAGAACTQTAGRGLMPDTEHAGWALEPKVHGVGMQGRGSASASAVCRDRGPDDAGRQRAPPWCVIRSVTAGCVLLLTGHMDFPAMQEAIRGAVTVSEACTMLTGHVVHLQSHAAHLHGRGLQGHCGLSCCRQPGCNGLCCCQGLHRWAQVKTILSSTHEPGLADCRLANR